jgi:uncharacterized protein YegP (UPF0339 family)
MKSLKEIFKCKKMGKIEIFKGTNEQFYFRVVASNGEIVAQSEGYVTKEGLTMPVFHT